MKKSLLSFNLLILIVLTVAINNSFAQISNYATIPYATGFENSTLDNNWYTTSSSNDGRIQIWNSTSLIWGGDTAKAHTDSLWLGMDVNTGANFVTNEAWFGLNLASQTNIRFSFWWAEWNDETQVEDGIYVSDNGGTTFTKIIDLDGDATTDLQWVYFDVNLDSVNSHHGLNFTSTYVIKLQQHDNYYFAGGNDGFMFDDINVSSTLSTNINNYNNLIIKSFPNPTSNNINISLKGFNNNPTYTLTSVDGKIIASGNFNTNYHTLDLTNYNNGLYFLNVKDNSNSKTIRVIKK